MKFFKIAILFVFLFVIVSCGQKKTIDPRYDDSLYQNIDPVFYKGKKDGNLYIKTMSFEKLKDKDTVKTLVYYYQQVPAIDIPSFSRLMHSGYYAKDKNHVYVWETTGTGEIVSILTSADPNTFTSIGYRWGKDTNAVYYESKILKGLNPAQLEPVCFEVLDSSLIHISFIKDNDQLYYRDLEVIVPDGLDLQKIYCKEDLLGNSFLAIDKSIYIVRNGTMVLFQ